MSSLVIHKIKRNGVIEYRVGSDISLSYKCNDKVQEPLLNIEDTINRYFELRPLCEIDTREELMRSLSERSISFDLDAYYSTVQGITEPERARELLLSRKQIEVLRDVANYLLKELKIPIEERHPANVMGEGDPDKGEFKLARFKVTIDDLTDCNEYINPNPHPNLTPSEVLALKTAYYYASWLVDSYTKSNPLC